MSCARIHTGPLLNVAVDLFPAAQVEIAYTEIRAVRQAEGFLQRGEQGLLDVIEDAGHEPRTYRCKISWILRKLGSADKAIMAAEGLADYGTERALSNTPCAKPREIEFNDASMESYKLPKFPPENIARHAGEPLNPSRRRDWC